MAKPGVLNKPPFVFDPNICYFHLTNGHTELAHLTLNHTLFSCVKPELILICNLYIY